VPTENPTLAVFRHTPVTPDDPGGNGSGISADQGSVPQAAGNGGVGVAFETEDCNTAIDHGNFFQKSTDGGKTFLTRPVRIDHPGEFKDNPNTGDLLPPTKFRAAADGALNFNKKTGTLTY